jgi:ATP-dependent Clp protease protease subunit
MGRESEREISELLAKRIVTLRGAIDDRAATALIAKLLFLQSEDAVGPIRLLIDSPGGLVAPGLAIRDTMDDITVPVHTHALTNVGGVAAVLLAHGARGHRTAIPRTQISVTPFTAAEGASAVQSEIERTEAIVTEMLAKDTRQSTRQIDADRRASRRFDAEQARSYGLIDRVEE